MNIRGSQKTFAIALGAAAGVILVAGILLVVLPQRSHVSRLGNDTVAAQAQLSAARAAAAAPKTHEPSVRATDLFRLAEAMPNTDRMPSILVQLSSLAKASSLTITAIKPSTKVPLQGYAALPLTVSVTGKYADLTRFARRLRDAVRASNEKLVVNGRLFDVNQIALTSADGRTVSAVLNLDAFDYVPTAPVLPATGAGSTPTPTTGGST